jgi:hypothetical protein
MSKIADTVDVMDPTAPDPEPEEITDRNDESWVESARMED